MKYLVLPLALVATGCALTPAQQQQQAAADAKQHAEMSKQLAGLTPGKPISCIRMRSVQHVKTYPGTILFKVSSSRIYRNDVSMGCNASRDDVLVTRTTMAQYCAGDIVQLQDRNTGMMTGSCGLGEFIPYTK
ncbi:hypothetical protein [Stakelama marina]|uniref:Lipoprotein n=1 Tax=Stakelama marina TaxID=2826939 RepID=A0A8T4IFT1_9SPHN|nr:hypothetical protein [Stakelama marina]MBR0553443.1 hypothetical protein [Stakelama marina]